VHADAIFSGWLATSTTIELSNAYFLAFETVIFQTNFVDNSFVYTLFLKQSSSLYPYTI
jgi:hypothetical protein